MVKLLTTARDQVSEKEESVGSPDQFNDDTGSIHGITSNLWSSATDRIKGMILHVLKKIACYSATNPGRVIVFTTITSIALLVVGFNTNFRLVTDNLELFTPFGSLSEMHQDWIENESNFTVVPNYSFFNVHSGGQNVLSVEGVSRVFQILDAIKALKTYSRLCRSSNDNVCRIKSVTNFWSDDGSVFLAEIPIVDNEEVIRVMSGKMYPDRAPVHRQSIFGNYEPYIRLDKKDYTDEDILLQTAELYQSTISYPDGLETDEFEKEFADLMSRLRKEWKNDGSDWRLEYLLMNNSVEREMKRAIDKDISLLIIAFAMMFLLCALYFAKRNLVRSQSILGIGAVLSILLSLMAVFGFLFCVGVPFTSMTQILPFILAGIGLDDAFIITGALSRTDPSMEIVNRVSKAIDEIGISIFLSTITTCLAFMLSSITKVPAVRWFCWYAGPCVAVDFIFQMSFFISYLVYDHRRAKAHRYDIICCWKSTDSESQPASDLSQVPEEKLSTTGQLVASYIDILLRPATKVVVLLVFGSILTLGILSAMEMTQHFDFTIMFTSDSYVADYFYANDHYLNKYSASWATNIYFRDIDLSSEENRIQIKSYLNDVVNECKYINEYPPYFWLGAFERFISQGDLQDLEFNDQMEVFLSTPPYDTMYSSDFARDEVGNISTSKTVLLFSNLDRSDTMGQIQAFAELREVTLNSSLNKGKNESSVFTFASFYYLWEFSSIVIKELLYTSLLSLSSIFILSLVFIPHPSGAFFVTITVSIIFVELVGLLRFAGVYINSITTVMLVMAIGLSVDFVMHFVHAYYETAAATREGKVCIAMMTIGSSLLVAGCSTFFGTVLLVFGSSMISYTFFLILVGVVILGVSNGLVLLPVILSLIGPLYNPKNPSFLATPAIIHSQCSRFFPNS